LAQELYDGQGKKIITYLRAEVRYLPQSLVSDVPKNVSWLQVGPGVQRQPKPSYAAPVRGAHKKRRRRKKFLAFMDEVVANLSQDPARGHPR